MIMRAKLETRPAVAQIRVQVDRATKDVAELMEWYMDLCAMKASFEAPRDTGFMRGAVDKAMVRAPLGFEVGWRESDFVSVGLPFYPVYQEFGTVKMRAQPTLGPIAREVFPQLERDIGKLLLSSFTRGHNASTHQSAA
jgi:hypothetical protein